MLGTTEDTKFIESNDLISQLYEDYRDLIKEENLKGKLFLIEKYLVFKSNNEFYVFSSTNELNNFLKNGKAKIVYKYDISDLKNITINEEMDCIFGFSKQEFVKISKNGKKKILKTFSNKPIVCHKTDRLYFIEEISLKFLDLKTNKEIIHIENIKYNEKDVSCFDYEDDTFILALKSNKIVFNHKVLHFHSSLIQFIKKDGASIVSVSNKLYITTGENSLSVTLVNNNIKYKIYNCLVTEKNIIINSSKGIFNYSREEGLLN